MTAHNAMLRLRDGAPISDQEREELAMVIQQLSDELWTVTQYRGSPKKEVKKEEQPLNFEVYQEKARKTAIYPHHLKVIYPALGLSGETGEVCEKIKKVFRDEAGYFEEYHVDSIVKELGDVLWYVAAIASDLEINLQDVAEANIRKLSNRAEKGSLRGSGDER